VSPIETLEAVRRLSEIARDFPSLAEPILGFVGTALSPTQHAEPDHVATSANGFAVLKRAHPNGRQTKYSPREYREQMLGVLRDESKSEYTAEEFAAMFNRAPITVGVWCRMGRLKATRGPRPARGGPGSWLIPASEVERYDNEGLLPLCRCRNT
jgi:hypothetical protein